MGVNKVEYGGETLIDLTEDSVTPETLAEGVTAHGADGEKVVGTLNLDAYQTKTDTNLATDSKQIVGAINELNEKVGKASTLEGTTWILNLAPSLSGTPTGAYNEMLWGYSINFKSNGTSYTSLECWTKSGGYARTLDYDDTSVYTKMASASTGSWIDTAYRTISITNGDDTANTELIDWLYENGTLLSVNLATVDKVKSIYTQLRGASELGIDDGIHWKSKFEFYDKEAFEGNTIASGDISHRIPLIAGDNIEFELLENAVKINATGSAPSNDSIVGTWVFNDDLTNPTEPITYHVSFEVNTSEYGLCACNEINIYDDGRGISFYGDYTLEDVWSDGDWSPFAGGGTITILEEPTDTDFISWLKANATKQEESGASNGFEMPQIRFANATYEDSPAKKWVDTDAPLTLTVEIVGGGALQVGDTLQICAKRTYHYKKYNENNDEAYPYQKQKLRCQQQCVITEEDLGKRFLTITTDDSIHSWLFKNDRKTSDSLSAFYMRIKRVTKYNPNTGQECDAIFSNVVTVWKTYNAVNQIVNIK